MMIREVHLDKMQQLLHLVLLHLIHILGLFLQEGNLVKSEVGSDGRGRSRSRPQQRRGTKRQRSPVSKTVSAVDERKKILR